MLHSDRALFHPAPEMVRISFIYSFVHRDHRSVAVIRKPISTHARRGDTNHV